MPLMEPPQKMRFMYISRICFFEKFASIFLASAISRNFPSMLFPSYSKEFSASCMESVEPPCWFFFDPPVNLLYAFDSMICPALARPRRSTPLWS